MAHIEGTEYDIFGAEDAPIVVLIHGLGLARASTWGAIIPILAQRFRVVSYDLLGHGASALPKGAVTLSALSHQLFALLDALGVEQAALVGFSLGGMINRRCAMDCPERVTALAILNAPHDRGETQQRLVEARARDTAEGGPEAGIDETLARWFTQNFRADHPEQVNAIRAILLANDAENYAAHRQVLAAGVHELIAPAPPLALPMLVMTCEFDTGSTPEMTHAIARETENAETIIVPHLQHLGLIEKPEAFSEPIADFLNRALK